MNFFLNAADRFTDLVTTTTDWSAPSPCEGWSAADLLDHLVDTQRDYISRAWAAEPVDPPESFGRVDVDHFGGIRMPPSTRTTSPFM